jgi:hypothetical protein
LRGKSLEVVVQGLELRVWGLRFMLQASGLRIYCVGVRAWGLWFKD